jgi:aryl-alcohol dehydrogenase-like predicted oxidoreductase
MIADADWTARNEHMNRFVSAQNNYSLLERRVEHEVNPACARFGLGMLPYFPLASGLLTGKYRSGIPGDSRGAMQSMSFLHDALTDQAKNAAVAKLEPIARDLGATTAQLAIAWVAKNPHVSSVITGASSVKQLKDNLQAADIIAKLTPDVLKRIDEITAPLAQ